MNKLQQSGGSSVGRAPSPEAPHQVDPVQVESGSQNEIEVLVESDLGSYSDQVATGSEYSHHDKDGKGENLGVGGSSPSHRTNLLATFTPRWLADDMVALARTDQHSEILEPSAGRGALVEAIHRMPHGIVDAVELNADFCKQLYDLNVGHVFHGDFLSNEMLKDCPPYTHVIMNPPEKSAMAHVAKAMTLLLRGGRLVALLHRNVALGVQEHLAPDARVYHIPDNTFQIEGRPIESSLLVWDA